MLKLLQRLLLIFFVVHEIFALNYPGAIDLSFRVGALSPTNSVVRYHLFLSGSDNSCLGIAGEDYIHEFTADGTCGNYFSQGFGQQFTGAALERDGSLLVANERLRRVLP